MYSIKGDDAGMTIPEMMKQDSIPGVSVVFIDNGEIAWKKCYGYSNLQDSSRVNTETVFTGASLSKPLSAIAALRTVESGLVDLDEDVNNKLTEWKVPETELTQNEKVTLRRLIAHEAGVKNDLWSSYLPNEEVPTLNQMLSGESPSKDPATSVITTPGTDRFYSNPGYSIIQKLLMDVHQNEFDAVMDSLVLAPVGMTSSSFSQPMPQDLMDRRAIGYSEDLTPYEYKLFPYQAAGGVWTTPTDLGQFMIALLDDHHQGSQKLISQETTKEIFNHDISRYVFSLWNWGDDIVFNHFGSNQGFNCFMYGSVDKRQGIVVMTNSDNSFGMFDYIQRAVNLEYDWEYVKPEVLEAIETEISWVEPFLGDYNWRGNELELNIQEGELYLSNEEENLRLVQTREREFIISEVPLLITFSKDPDENVMTIWGPGGAPAFLEKIAP
ncbi:MAG: beta-lactamase family protein [Flavobacteriales bacterium]|nr:beta-lactamase family protein [Flavobacteriales bacterium]